MAEVLNHLRRLLGVFAELLDKLSPWAIPWPLTFALVFPLIAAVLAVMVWSSRGKTWPVRCDYPNTTTGHPCRNRVFGEWQRCHHHRPGRRKRSGRPVDELFRWQIMRRGRPVERDDIHGRGFLREHSRIRGLLYYRGFARPPRNVATFARTWWTERRGDMDTLRSELRQAGGSGLRAVFTGAAHRSANLGVSDRLVQVIQATRLTLVLVLVGLVLMGFAVWQGRTSGDWVNYTATSIFVAAWAVAQWGIWSSSTTESRPHERGGWLRVAAVQALKWYAAFMLISVLAGEVIERIEKLVGGPDSIRIGI